MENIHKRAPRARPIGWALAAIACLAACAAGCATDSGEYAQAPGYRLIGRSVIGGPGRWDFIAFEPSRQRLYISRSDRVQVWSPPQRKLVGEIARTAGVHGIALAEDLGRGFTSNGQAATLSVFRLDDLSVIGVVPIPGLNPDAILYAPDFRRVYAFGGRSRDVTVVDAVRLEVLASIPLGGKPEVAVEDGAGHLFVNIEDTSELVMIDQASNTIRARWSLGACKEPTGLAIDIVHHRLFSACANKTMAVIDATSGRIVADVAIGEKPDGAAFDPSSATAFSANGDGTLTAVRETDPEHFLVAATISTAPGARTLSLDPISHRIYLVTAAFGPVPAATSEHPHPRAPVLPNSFEVLVVGAK